MPAQNLEEESEAMKKFPILGSVLALAVAGSIATVPAVARTHHPSTKTERAQTRDLNKQQLAIAQGQAPANQQAMNGSAQPPAQSTPNQNVPADQTMNGGQTAQAPAPQSQAPQGSSPSQQPAPQQSPQAPPSGQ
jgi:hypothetical protein